ncbi:MULTISPECIES: dimethylarginine dimethylaminohydrolase family protein [unclassified Olleya]|uniref:dimethylarginine dimethylaminohydrolase family protein n=1 Tax=unclassified Olleya TaxID=2615019 RepID=UPI000C304E3C|nr:MULTISPECIES: arginine deiminase family protein [unclassified Olleya]AUC77448.1 amidinotransferase [Olleya sp. Bg11-27]QXP59842.1 amidinotransferase [Olleya sp. HaHaR_3_96]
MLELNVKNETSRLRAVVLGTAVSNGPTPKLEEAYDPKSLLHIKAGTYPVESDMVKEMEAVAAIFDKYDVKVYRPELIQDCNQIFARDIAFVIDDVFVKANILPERENELEAIQYIIDQIDPKKVIRPPEEVHIEGGDVMLCNDYIFIGTYRGADYSDYIVARTNKAGVDFITEQFPHKKVKSFDLNKSQTNAHDNALHLDCCFQPIGTNKAILHKEGFRDDTEFEWLLAYFGKENCFIISKDEMFNMNSNIFSISENVIISEKNFTRLNTWLRDNGFTVEEVPYAEIAKQEGLLRCSTMPLLRD